MAKTSNRQTTMAGIEPATPKAISVGKAVASIIDLERSTAVDAERAAQAARTKCGERATKRREKIMAKLATDADRDLARRMLEPALAAMRGEALVRAGSAAESTSADADADADEKA